MPKNNQAKNKTSPVRIAAKERRSLALKLRLAGIQFKDIGKQLGCSRQRAAQLVEGEMENIIAQNAELAAQVRDMELVRLDTIQSGIWSQATSGNHGAIDRVLRIMERRSKLLGLDAPQQLQVESHDGHGIADMIALANDPKRLAEYREECRRLDSQLDPAITGMDQTE